MSRARNKLVYIQSHLGYTSENLMISVIEYSEIKNKRTKYFYIKTCFAFNVLKAVHNTRLELYVFGTYNHINIK